MSAAFVNDLAEGASRELEACQVLQDFTGFPWTRAGGKAYDLEGPGGTAEVKFDRKVHLSGNFFFELAADTSQGLRPSGLNAYGPDDAPTWWLQGSEEGWRVYPYMDLRRALCAVREAKQPIHAGDNHAAVGLLVPYRLLEKEVVHFSPRKCLTRLE